VDKVAVWVVAGLLAYICFVLTSISGKLDGLGMSGVEVATLNEVKPHSADAKEPHISFYREAESSLSNPAQGVLFVASVIAIFVSWHISRIYHNHQWTKRLLRKTYAQYNRPYPLRQDADLLHPDQDCVGDPPPPDGSIKDSWLPAHVHEYRYRMRLKRPPR
jgi:hypothetical protein